MIKKKIYLFFTFNLLDFFGNDCTNELLKAKQLSEKTHDRQLGLFGVQTNAPNSIIA